MKQYIVPADYKSAGGVSLSRMIEATVITLVLAIPILLLTASLMTFLRIWLLIIVTIPVYAVCIIGINGDSLRGWVMANVRFALRRRDILRKDDENEVIRNGTGRNAG
jgi:hypothetical protein